VSPGATSFYATVAQVIPVLFLALVIEQRVWDPKEHRLFGLFATHRVQYSGGLLVVVSMIDFALGESFALLGISGHDSTVSRVLVWNAVGLAGMLLLLPPFAWATLNLVPSRNTDLVIELWGIRVLAMLAVAVPLVGAVIAVSSPSF
jgi:hypothetical protein